MTFSTFLIVFLIVGGWQGLLLICHASARQCRATPKINLFVRQKFFYVYYRTPSIFVLGHQDRLAVVYLFTALTKLKEAHHRRTNKESRCCAFWFPAVPLSNWLSGMLNCWPWPTVVESMKVGGFEGERLREVAWCVGQQKDEFASLAMKKYKARRIVVCRHWRDSNDSFFDFSILAMSMQIFLLKDSVHVARQFAHHRSCKVKRTCQALRQMIVWHLGCGQ